jgi:hypothetical protein
VSSHHAPLSTIRSIDTPLSAGQSSSWGQVCQSTSVANGNPLNFLCDKVTAGAFMTSMLRFLV